MPDRRYAPSRLGGGNGGIGAARNGSLSSSSGICLTTKGSGCASHQGLVARVHLLNAALLIAPLPAISSPTGSSNPRFSSGGSLA